MSLWLAWHSKGGSHSGDLLPMPPWTRLESVEMQLGVGEYDSALKLLTNLSVVGLNFLSGGGRRVMAPERPNLAQRSSQRRLCEKWWGLIRRAGDSDDFLNGAAAASCMWNPLSSTTRTALVAARVDGLEHCGLVDPSFCLPDEMRELFNDPDLLFPEGVMSTPKVVRFTGGSRREYAALARQQLQAGKVALMPEPVC